MDAATDNPCRRTPRVRYTFIAALLFVTVVGLAVLLIVQTSKQSSAVLVRVENQSREVKTWTLPVDIDEARRSAVFQEIAEWVITESYTHRSDSDPLDTFQIMFVYSQELSELDRELEGDKFDLDTTASVRSTSNYRVVIGATDSGSRYTLEVMNGSANEWNDATSCEDYDDFVESCARVFHGSYDRIEAAAEGLDQAIR